MKGTYDMNWSEDMQHHKPKMLDDSIMQSRKTDLKAVTEDHFYDRVSVFIFKIKY